jgi:hypothetical protein
MRVDEILREAQQLNRYEKWQVVQRLMTDLALEEGISPLVATSYEVWSPYDSAEAANVLLAMLDADEKHP